MALAATAVSLAILAANLKYQRQQVVLDQLEAEVAASTAKAKGVRAALDRLGQDQASLLRLRSRKGEPGFLDVWEETTRILPDHSWLTELRLSEMPEARQIVISGFSNAAASLVGLIHQSELFSDASLIAPISVDPTEDKERFAIQATIKRHAKSRTASR